MKNNYTFPVIITKGDDGYDINLIDFPNMSTYAERKEDIVTTAQEAFALILLDMEERKFKIPAPSDVTGITLKKGQWVLYINIWMPYHRTAAKVIYARKNLSIPVWLDQLAKAQNINFSQTLVDALKVKLGLEG